MAVILYYIKYYQSNSNIINLINIIIYRLYYIIILISNYTPMIIRNYRKQSLKSRLVILFIATFFFIISFVLNITSNEALYDENLNLVPILQNGPIMGSYGFMYFMNVVSDVFDPNHIAVYIFIMKLEIIVFMLWFFFMSWVLGMLKMAIHQARPFWVPGSSVKMYSWICYTDYGCPSGHSMLAMILLQSILRFFARVRKTLNKYIAFGYILIFGLQLLVMFSRMMLGMHSINQVLFGLSIALYSFVPYYLFIQHFILKMVLAIFNHPRSSIVFFILFIALSIFYAIQLLSALVPFYDTGLFLTIIRKTQGCAGVQPYSSFQYACLMGTSMIMSGFGTLVGLNCMKKPAHLQQKLAYSRISLKFLAKFIITIILACIPLAIFMNPLWKRINTSEIGKTMISWAIQNLQYFWATFFIIFLSPIINGLLGLEQYKSYDSFADFKKDQVVDMLQVECTQIVIPRQRQTEMTTSKMSQFTLKVNRKQ